MVVGARKIWTGSCAFGPCERPAKTKGFCDMHYRRWRRYGMPDPGASDFTKTCKYCNAEFRNPVGKGNCADHCPACRTPEMMAKRNRERTKVWRIANPEKARTSMRWGKLSYVYGVTKADFLRMAEEQENACAICRKIKPLVVDHCHKGGAVRALLCRGCNFGVGNFYEDAEAMENAVRYVRRFQP